jgi:hypothetical protein
MTFYKSDFVIPQWSEYLSCPVRSGGSVPYGFLTKCVKNIVEMTCKIICPSSVNLASLRFNTLYNMGPVIIFIVNFSHRVVI